MAAPSTTTTRQVGRFASIGAYQVATVSLLVFVFCFVSIQQVWHTDVWGHLRFGEYIVTHRELPKHEMFSGDFADQDKPYLNFQWLAQVSGYLVYEMGARWAGGDAKRQLAGGAFALAIEHAVLVTLRLLVLLIAFRRLTGSAGTALLGIVLVIGFGVDHIFVHRPQAFGELFFALLLLALSQPVLSRNAAVWIPLVMVLWANFHGSFPMGFVLLGAFLAGRAIEIGLERIREVGFRISNLAHWLWRDIALRRLVLVVVLSLVAVAILNPHGPMLYVYSVEMSGHPNIKYMEEWKPLPVETMSGYLFLASVAMLVPLVRCSPQRFTPTQVLLLLGFGLQSMTHVRVLVWWSVVVVWVALPHLAALGLGLPTLGRRLLAGLFVFVSSVAALRLAAMLLLWWSPGLWAGLGSELEPQKHVTDKTPWEVSLYLQDQYDNDQRLKRTIFTSETLGDYLLWDLRLDPPVRVFCYTHVHLLTKKHWEDCMAVKFGEHGWEEILDRNNVQFLIVEDNSLYQVLIEEVRAASDRWSVQFDSPIFVARRKPAPVK
jgi:hypothetical protein